MLQIYLRQQVNVYQGCPVRLTAQNRRYWKPERLLIGQRSAFIAYSMKVSRIRRVIVVNGIPLSLGAAMPATESFQH